VAKKPLPARVGEYISLGFLLPASTLAGYVIGYLMDKEFDTRWMYIAGIVLGSVAGFVKLVQQLTRDMRDGE
jgi:F0F1-type ATP synthase assembly protein I